MISYFKGSTFRPVYCDVCSSDKIRLTTTKLAYRHHYENEWPLMYICDNCDASVRCHQGTSNPLGYMADKQTRLMRQKAHEYFDAAWKKAGMSRSEAYRWLAPRMNMSLRECHIGMMTKEQCSSVIDLCYKGIKK